MKAAERIAYYASRFGIVEVNSTERFPATPDLARQWVDRTPDGFVFDVLGWALLTHRAALPDSLFADLQEHVRIDLRDRQRRYAHHLPNDIFDECARRFGHALLPLHDAGKLGTVVLRYPRWYRPSQRSMRQIVHLRQQLEGLPISVELHNHRWFEGEQCETTFSLLEEANIGFVCQDWRFEQKSAPAVVAATTGTAVVRMRGDAAQWGYRYTKNELLPWVDRVATLADSCDEVHVLFDTCHRDAAVGNAELFVSLLLKA